ncbi:hypothetical protein H0H87_006660 [Tephrocybe sp. NHM501043]|nr:hypothetical protein H0H87_006660 [Tephrocybe sp. NHM501043]
MSLESLTIDRKNQILYAMLQSATIQDGGDDKSTSRYTRLLAYNVSDASVRSPLVGEWVVPLPLSDKDNTEECNEIHFVSPGIFLALSRDGDGHGGDDDNTKYKNADLFSIVGATNIHGTSFDDPSNPIATDGKLNKNIIPATYVSFVQFHEENGLERFGLHNGQSDYPSISSNILNLFGSTDSPADETLIDAKWESLTLAPVGDPDFPDDFFLFSVVRTAHIRRRYGLDANAVIKADNDFLTTDGVSLGKSCSGIALTLREKYPSQYQLYKSFCEKSSPKDLIGTCLLIPGEKHYIACLFTSRDYGKRKDKPSEILAATSRFNSGKFGVLWEDTEKVLLDLGVSMVVYTPK